MASTQKVKPPLHHDFKLRNKAIHSGQASIFYVRKENIVNEDYVLKVFKPDEEHSFKKEVFVFQKLNEHQSQCKCEVIGFPKMKSYKQDEERSEILMEELGYSLKTLMRKYCNGKFSEMTVYQIMA